MIIILIIIFIYIIIYIIIIIIIYIFYIIIVIYIIVIYIIIIIISIIIIIVVVIIVIVIVIVIVVIIMIFIIIAITIIIAIIIIIIIIIIIPLLQRSCPSVRLSIRRQNRIRSVSSTILTGSISYLHIVLTDFRRSFALKMFVKFENLRFWQFLKNCNFDCALCPCDINVKVESWPEFLLQPLLIFKDDISRWFTQRSGFGQNC